MLHVKKHTEHFWDVPSTFEIPDASSFFCISSNTFVRKFRHVTGLLPAAMQVAFPCFQKTIVYSLSVLLQKSVS